MHAKSKLLDFFLSLNDGETLKRFQADPESAMSAAGLSDDDKALIRSGDEARVREALGEAGAGISYVIVPGTES